MDIDPAFEAGPQFSHAGKPGMRAFNHQAISTQAIVAFHALAGGAWGHPSSLQVVTVPCTSGLPVARSAPSVIPLRSLSLRGRFSRDAGTQHTHDVVERALVVYSRPAALGLR